MSYEATLLSLSILCIISPGGWVVGPPLGFQNTVTQVKFMLLVYTICLFPLKVTLWKTEE